MNADLRARIARLEAEAVGTTTTGDDLPHVFTIHQSALEVEPDDPRLRLHDRPTRGGPPESMTDIAVCVVSVRESP